MESAHLGTAERIALLIHFRPKNRIADQMRRDSLRELVEIDTEVYPLR